MHIAIGSKDIQEIVGVELSSDRTELVQKPLSLPSGLRRTTSRCCEAPVITVGRGLRGDICQKCGKPHEEPRFN